MGLAIEWDMPSSGQHRRRMYSRSHRTFSLLRRKRVERNHLLRDVGTRRHGNTHPQTKKTQHLPFVHRHRPFLKQCRKRPQAKNLFSSFDYVSLVIICPLPNIFFIHIFFPFSKEIITRKWQMGRSEQLIDLCLEPSPQLQTHTG